MRTTSNLSEDVLCRRCAQGDREAWETLVTEYGIPMRHIMARLLGSAHHRALDEVLVEFWWALFKDHCLVLRRFEKEKGNLTAYFSGVARNLVRASLHRENARAKRQVSLSSFSPEHFPIKDLSMTEFVNDLESKATKAERRFLRDWLLVAPESEARFSKTNRRALTARLFDKAWPIIHGDAQFPNSPRHAGDCLKRTPKESKQRRQP